MDNKDTSNIDMSHTTNINLDKIKQYSKYYVKRLLHSPTIVNYKNRVAQSGGTSFADTYKKYKEKSKK